MNRLSLLAPLLSPGPLPPYYQPRPVVRHALSHDRAGARRARHHRHRRALPAVHLLHGIHRRRRLEDHRCRPHLGQRLRRLLLRRLDGRRRGLAVRSECRLRGHRLVQDPQQRVDRARHLQVHRRGQDLDLHWTARHRTNLDDSRPSHESGHRLRRGSRKSVRSQQRARRLSHYRRRQDLEECPLHLRHSRRGRSRDSARQPRT